MLFRLTQPFFGNDPKHLTHMYVYVNMQINIYKLVDHIYIYLLHSHIYIDMYIRVNFFAGPK